MNRDIDWVWSLVLDPLPTEALSDQEELGLEGASDSSRRPCICGGAVWCDDGDVIGAVARHISSGIHREWLAMGSFAVIPDPEMLGRIPLDLSVLSVMPPLIEEMFASEPKQEDAFWLTEREVSEVAAELQCPFINRKSPDLLCARRATSRVGRVAVCGRHYRVARQFASIGIDLMRL